MFADSKAVFILHGSNFRSFASLFYLFSGNLRESNIFNFAFFYLLIEKGHCCFYWCFRAEPVNLVEINAICFKPLKTLIKDFLEIFGFIVGFFSRNHSAFCGYNQSFWKRRKSAAYSLLAF